MAGSEYSRTARDVVIACLTLWSVASLVVIVVWVTSPSRREASQCRAELQSLEERLEGEQAVWERERGVLEDKLMEGQENMTQLRRHADQVTHSQRDTNGSLTDCQKSKDTISVRVSVLENTTAMYKSTAENLSAQSSQLGDSIHMLGLDVDQTKREWNSCIALQSDAEDRQREAEKETINCLENQQYLLQQLQKSFSSSPCSQRCGRHALGRGTLEHAGNGGSCDQPESEVELFCRVLP